MYNRLFLSSVSLLLCILMLFSCSGTQTPDPLTKEPTVKNEDGEIVNKTDKDKNSIVGGLMDRFFGDSDLKGGMAEAPSMESDGAYDAVDSIVPGSNITVQAGTLTAGEWRDNKDYAEFLKTLNENEWYEYMKTWGIYPVRRKSVRLLQGTDPVKNAKVSLIDADGNVIFNAVTDHNGEAYLFYDLLNEKSQSTPLSVFYSYLGISETVKLDEGEDVQIISLSNGLNSDTVKKLDLMFMIDTTGSMGDELHYIQEELRDVILRVSDIYEDMEIRLSVNFYRDHGDEYTVRYFKFNGDIDEAIKNLKDQYASGGGDYPEAVDEAFLNAVDGHAWDEDAVKLMFFVLDAPPHSDRQGSTERIQNTVLSAAEKGIRVIPVASSGVDKETEYLLRTMALTTGGTYVFLTNDSGVGGDHLDPTVGDYKVEKLNELMIRLIKEYCA